MDNYRSNRGGDSYGGRGGRDGGRRNFRERSDRPEMFGAVCDKCGKDCEVPFRPSTDKPIYCSECFKSIAPRRDDRNSRDSRPPRRDSYSSGDSSYRGNDNKGADVSQLKEQLSSISGKLDKLLHLLTPVITEEVVEVDSKKEKAIKKVAKKAVKKAVSKKKEVKE